MMSWTGYMRMCKQVGMAIAAALLVVLVGLGGCQAQRSMPGQAVQVSRVVSGQLLEILAPQTTLAERVRLLGIEAPDWRQVPWSKDAKQHLETLIQSSVWLETDVEPYQALPDGSRRRLVYLWSKGELLNETLVAAGYALAFPRSPNTKYQQRLDRAQETARLLGRGIWNPAQPMLQTPSEFRQQSASQDKSDTDR